MLRLQSFKKRLGFLKSKKFNNITENLSVSLMLFPTVLLFVLFCLYPIIYLLFFSFTDYDGIHAAQWVGFTNYINAAKDSSWWAAVWNTIQLGIMVPVVQIPLSLLLAVILNSKIRGRDGLRALFFLPNITSTAVMGIIFYFIFSADSGIINAYLKILHLTTHDIDWFSNGLTAKLIIALFRIWYGIGFYMVLFLAALQKIPHEVYESALIDGSNRRNTFFKITLPLLGRMFQIITALSILDAMKLFDSVKAITNGAPGGQTEVMTMYIFTYFFEGGGGGSAIARQGYASAVSIIATIIIAFVSVAYLLISRKAGEEEE